MPETHTLQAVVTDMDGSLLGPDCTIGAEDLRTIHKLKAKGIPVFVATGRHHAICRWYFEDIGTDYPAVTCNGAMLYDFAADRTLYCELLDPADITALVAFTRENNLFYYVHSDTHCYLNSAMRGQAVFETEMALFKQARQDEFGLMGEGFDPMAHKVVKIMIPDCSVESLEKLQQTPIGQKLVASFSGDSFLDVNPTGSNKGAAVCRLAQQYGFALENTLAMGDNFNDVEMLGTVGYPVVPASADERIQALARLVTCPSGQNPLTYAIHALFPQLLG